MDEIIRKTGGKKEGKKEKEERKKENPTTWFTVNLSYIIPFMLMVILFLTKTK